MSPDAHRLRARRRARALAATLAAAGVIGFGALVVSAQQQTGPAVRGPHGGVVDQATVTRGDHREDTVAAMLERRAAALRSGDRSAFLDTVDDSDPDFRTAQAAWFDNLSAVPFSAWSLTLGSRAAAVVPQAARDLAERRPAGSFAAEVDSAYRIAGYDNADQRYDRVYTVTPRDGRWYVSGAFDPADAPAHRELWDVGKVHVLSAEHGLILGLDPSSSLRTYADAVDRAVPRVNAVWGTGWSRRVLVEVTRTEDEMSAILGGAPSAYRQLAAVTRGELGTQEGSSAAERIIINPKAYRELSDVGRQVIMGHEITHVAARERTQPWTPRWLAEGFADYIGYRDSGLSVRVIAQELVGDVHSGYLPDSLPEDADFSATNSALAQSYEMSWLACRLIAEQYGGSNTLVAFYRAVGSPGGAGEVNKAFADVLDTTPADFTRDWRDYVRSELD
jgi:hypothetical protein